jgi:phytoene dehydrogenase-like protein
MAKRFDAIVVGGGPNGLAAATRLAKRGRAVLLVEARATLGGLSGRIDFHPGYAAPGVLHDDGRLSDFATGALDLGAHGLVFRDAPPVLVTEPEGPGLLLGRDERTTAALLAERSPRDGESWLAYRAFFRCIAPFVRSLMTSPPPPLSPASIGDWIGLAKRGLGLARLGRRDGVELARVAPMCVADYLNERFTIPALVEGLAGPAVAGTWSGPWSAGTATQLILHETAPARRIAGGPAALVAALERAARAAGVEIRTGAAVERIRIDGDGVTGVTLAGGEAIDAAVVVATCDPKRAMLALAEPGTLPLGTEEEFRRVRSRGTAAKVLLALDGPFELAARPGERIEELRIGGDHVDDLERAFDAVKYRQVSAHPWLDVRVPSLADPSLAPAGGTTISVLASFAPHVVEGGWTDERREALGNAVVARLEELSPGLGARIVGGRVLSPADLERDFLVTGGQLHHVEPALDQLFLLRPTPGSARSATAVPGLYLGGAGSHGGGGGVGCDAGVLAAEAVLTRRLRRD